MSTNYRAKMIYNDMPSSDLLRGSVPYWSLHILMETLGRFVPARTFSVDKSSQEGIDASI